MERPRNLRGPESTLWREPFIPATEAGDNIYFSGDSITAGDVWPASLRARLRGAPAAHNVAVGGVTLESRISADTTLVDPYYAALATMNVVFCWCGTNDLSIGAGTTLDAAGLLEFYRQYCAARRSVGFVVVIGTMMPRGNASVPAAFESERVAFNALLRSSWSTFTDALMDVAADSRLGAPGANTNPVYFLDESGAWVHPTTAGYAIVANMAVVAYNDLKRRILAR